MAKPRFIEIEYPSGVKKLTLIEGLAFRPDEYHLEGKRLIVHKKNKTNSSGR